jgi:hypothetical protein
VLVLSRLIYRAWIVEKHIEALGGHAHVIPAMFPFGFDLIYRDVRAAITHKSMELWQTLFYESKGSHTAEATVMGQRIVFTDDPKNIKAILSAQFQDFGKWLTVHELANAQALVCCRTIPFEPSSAIYILM